MGFLPLLAVDKDDAVYERETVAWARIGVRTVRVDSMHTAISLLVKQDFLFIAINADNIDYLAQMPIMRITTDVPIFVFTENYDTAMQTKSVKSGVDVYLKWHKTPDETVEGVMAFLDQYSQRKQRHKRSLKILFYDDILLSVNHHRVFIGDKEVRLTPLEFNILYMLMRNREQILTHQQIIRSVWKSECDDVTRASLWNHIKHLRDKLDIDGVGKKYIESIHSIGYTISTITY